MDPIVIACSADERYALGLAVTVRSLLETLSARPVTLFILDGGLTEETKAKLLESWNVGTKEVHFLKPDPAPVAHLTLKGDRNPAQYFRLLLPELLPPHCEKALYLDSDVLIRRDISPLWDTDLGEAPLAAVQDFGVPVVSSEPWGIANSASFGLATDEPYFNAGVMLLNVPVWKKEGIAENVIRFTETHGDTVRLWEQDGLNVLLHGRWKHLDPRWNDVSSALKTFDWWKPTDEQRSILPLLAAGAWITHFAAVKPWAAECNNAERDAFFAVLDRTAWKGWRRAGE